MASLMPQQFFQALVNDVFRDFQGKFVFVHVDDILIYSQNIQQYKNHIQAVLQRLLENQQFVKAEKCEFHVLSVSFLGFIFEGGLFHTDPEKTKAVGEWPVLENRKQLQQFLGFTNVYRRFIRNYSRIAAPLTKLTSMLFLFLYFSFSWTPEAETALKKLKHPFSTAPILCHPDPERQFILEVNASDMGVGAVLSQQSPEDNKDHTCAFFLLTSDPFRAKL